MANNSSGAGLMPVNSSQLQQVHGRMCEVRKIETNALIFVGRILRVDDHSFSVFPTARSEAPPVMFNAPFKLVIHLANSTVKTWCGLICGSSPVFWRFDHFSSFHNDELRGTFRQTVSRPITVVYLDPEIENEEDLELCPGRLVDISLSGMQITVPRQYDVGSYVMVSDLRLTSANAAPYSFTTQICWARAGARKAMYYGLQFLPMSASMEDRLCCEIFDLQRLDIIAKREHP